MIMKMNQRSKQQADVESNHNNNLGSESDLSES